MADITVDDVKVGDITVDCFDGDSVPVSWSWTMRSAPDNLSIQHAAHEAGEEGGPGRQEGGPGVKGDDAAGEERGGEGGESGGLGAGGTGGQAGSDTAGGAGGEGSEGQKEAKEQRTGKQASRGDARDDDVKRGDTGKAPGLPSVGGGNESIARQRAHVIAQLREPATRNLLAAIIGHEHNTREGRADVAESLINRAVRTGKHPADLMKGGFYGPFNKGPARAMAEKGAPRWALEDADYAISRAAAGGNRLGGRDDQGFVGWSNGRWHEEVKPGGRIKLGGEHYGWHTPSSEAWARAHGYGGGGGGGDAAPASISPSVSGLPAAVGGRAIGEVSPGAANLHRVDPFLRGVMGAAAAHMPSGYTVKVTPHGGYSPTHGSPGSQHRQGRALDVQIFHNGQAIPNRGRDTTGMYELLARHARGEAHARGGHVTWGGAFGTSSGHPYEADLMHFDLGAERGRIRSQPAIGVPGHTYGKSTPAAAETRTEGGGPRGASLRERAKAHRLPMPPLIGKSSRRHSGLPDQAGPQWKRYPTRDWPQET